MCHKIIFVVAALCVVNASVITIDVHEDDPQSVVDFEESSSFASCDNQECDQRCRRLKFPGGICVRGRCKCDNFLTFENTRSVQKVLTFTRSCNRRDCNERCERLGYAGGVCVKDRCKCKDIELNEEDVELEELSSPRRCYYRECEQRCRRIGYPGGACVNGRCKCDSRMNADIEFEETDITSTGICWPKACDRVCRILGFNNGTCVDGKCKCVKKEGAADTEDLIAAEPFWVSEELRKCNINVCHRNCIRKGYRGGGVCLGSRCQCRIPRTINELINNEKNDEMPEESNLEVDEEAN
ncbi:uncharacterized protein LOC142974297 isoform X3 [Anticarsia gemmatalis]|uniref:uncharacterized protein LOC142974297 isoform X3 n=1 Tax=Anticarsia gemmatalis TaxID=129554 RepID=UPI003F7714FE